MKTTRVVQVSESRVLGRIVPELISLEVGEVDENAVGGGEGEERVCLRAREGVAAVQNNEVRWEVGAEVFPSESTLNLWTDFLFC